MSVSPGIPSLQQQNLRISEKRMFVRILEIYRGVNNLYLLPNIIRMRIEIWLGNLKGRGQSENVGLDWRIILKLT
jgi:hypothetical protein